MKQQRTFSAQLAMRVLFIALVTQTMVSCGMFTKTANPNATTAKKVPTEYGTKPPTSGQMAMMNYVEKYKTIAMREMERTGVPASIKLAQGLLESNAGRSELSTMSNNHFGIKCHSDWQGERYFKEDDDKDPLTGQLIKSCFRKYQNPEESFAAHSDFLRDPRKVNRYGSLFLLNKNDYAGWANGLQRAGYATATDYGEKLIRIIEDYQLAQYDNVGGAVANNNNGSRPNDDFQTGGGTWQPNPQGNANNTNSGNNTGGWNPNSGNNNGGGFGQPMETEGTRNDARYVRAVNGESLYELAGKSGLSVAKLQEFNEELTEPNRPLPVGTVVYTQRKRNSYRGDQKVHVVKDCETMYDIAQKYGMKLSKLLSKNEMREGEQPAIGSVLVLRRGWFEGATKPALRDTFGEWQRCRGGALIPNALPSQGQGQPNYSSGRPSNRVDFEISPNSGNNSGSTGAFGDQPYFPPVSQPNNSGYPNNQGSNTGTYVETPSTGTGTVTYPTYTPSETPTTSGSSTTTYDPYPSYPSYPSKPTTSTTTTSRPTTTTATPPKPINNPRPTAPTTAPAAKPPVGGQLHTVAVGETLWAISRKYGTTVDALKKLNNIPDNTIKIGQQLRVK